MTTNTFATSMFSKLRDSLLQDKNKTDNSLYRHILKMETGKTYVVRLLPNTKNPEQSMLHHYVYSFNSFATGEPLIHVSPTSFNNGERDPVAEIRYKLYRTDKEKSSKINRSERWLINAYVISDPTNPDNEGQVKIIRVGRQLYNIIQEAMIGEDSDEYGPRIVDLSENGVNLKIKVIDQGGFPNYTSSRFTAPCAIPGMTEEKMQEIYDNTFDLAEVLTVPTYEELERRVREHILCDVEPEVPKQQLPIPPISPQKKTEEKIEEKKKKPEPITDDDDYALSDDELASILPDMDDLEF